MRTPRNILSIAGTDPTGGAGIQADLKTFAALKAHGMAAITAVVAQNTVSVRSFVSLEPEFVGEQIDSVFSDVHVDAVKIGMVPTAKIARIIADRLRHHGAKNVVLDPVMIAKSGDSLLHKDAIAAIRDHLIPISSVITPNLPEAAVLLGIAPAQSLEEMEIQLHQLNSLGSRSVLLKGGHLVSEHSIDLLLSEKRVIQFTHPRIVTKNDHGTGCTLSSAIAAAIPDSELPDAVEIAKRYVSSALEASNCLSVGRGHGPLHHFHALW